MWHIWEHQYRKTSETLILILFNRTLYLTDLWPCLSVCVRRRYSGALWASEPLSSNRGTSGHCLPGSAQPSSAATLFKRTPGPHWPQRTSWWVFFKKLNSSYLILFSCQRPFSWCKPAYCRFCIYQIQRMMPSAKWNKALHFILNYSHVS